MILLKKLFLVIGVISFLFLVGFIYLKANPPLAVPGITFYTYEETKRIVSIENNGFTSIKLKNVLVNGKKAKNVELGVSRTLQMVSGTIRDGEQITFHNINEFDVKPRLRDEEITRIIEEEKGDRQTIIHYGLRVTGNEPPEKITIKYTYLGIPYSIEVDVKEER